MAVTKLLRLKMAARGNPASHLKNNIFYICNKDKCGGGMYIGGNAGTSPKIIYDTMIENKRYWGKKDGSQGFHYVISFPKGMDISQDQAFAIAEDFAKELLGDRFYYAFAVHNDKAHMHVHITFDSVSKTDGYKYHSPKGDWERRIQPITDKICKKYDLPPLTFGEERKGKNYGQWRHDQEKEKGVKIEDVTWYDLIRDDIDRAVLKSRSFEQVLDNLKEMGYQIKLGKYLSLRPYGKERPVRSSRLGEGYSVEEIRKRAEKGKETKKSAVFIRYGNPDIVIAALKIKKRKRKDYHLTPFQRKFYLRWHNCYLRNRPGGKCTYRSNRDVVRIRRLSDAVKYMIDQDIRDFPGLEDRWKQLMDEQRRDETDLALLQKEKRKRQEEELQKSLAEREKQLRDNIREMRKRQQLLEDLYTFYFEMPKPKVRRPSDGYYDVRDLYPKGDDRTRITVHKSLISGRGEDGSYIVKIPGKEEMITLPERDCFMYKSGQVLSAFIYDHKEYLITSINEGNTKTIKGEMAKAFFAKQKDRQREGGAK